ncbi:MAG: ADP-ribosylglycohydrolase family protein [Methanosarcina flavescens]|jgi:ADP-ribosylglycohydrolase|uniref:ADP-ribosylglycohydrolase family protein n=1 Tax=Methanosarcina flavescens TaxID=1715806 RepID=A0A660HQL6_9EURY|nr:ADP-ribosylglycohydrolase family protein [Methanosarcina flavescens]AYK14547.1 ADP-ribosylglycohydrolase family protein [Methanosarcina flavescens]NLK33021.1 ADP-ribosylglycohydrolase family protein [Methanosarcina flavescens]
MRTEKLPDVSDIEKKLRGYLFGTACADALGRPVEHLTLEQIKSTYGEKGILELSSDSPWTDDTQLMLVLARGLLRGAELEIPGLMDRIAEELVFWLDEPDLGAGATTRGAALSLKDGIPWSKSGLRSKTCGSLMRAGILGFVFQNDPQKLVKVALISGRITHSHPVAEAASLAGAYAVKLALDGVEPGDMFEPLFEVTQGISEEFTHALESSYKTAYSDIKDEEGLRKLGQGWYADETFALAYFCILRYPHDYKKAVQTAVNITGDSDSVGGVAGGILGARLGIDAIPVSWIEALKWKKELEKTVEPLLEKYFQVSGDKLKS